jgi:prepilin peptidase CpaA
MAAASAITADLTYVRSTGTCAFKYHRPRRTGRAWFPRLLLAGAARPMTPPIDLFPLACFAALMVTAAIVDFRRLVIPNSVVVALCILWPMHIESMRGASLAIALESIAGALVVFAAGAVLFARGVVGGGDVKLLAAASLWAGAGAIPALLIATALIGGGLALVFLTPLGRLSGAGQHIDEITPAAAIIARGRTPIPYGIAIAAAALIVTIPPYFG